MFSSALIFSLIFDFFFSVLRGAHLEWSIPPNKFWSSLLATPGPGRGMRHWNPSPLRNTTFCASFMDRMPAGAAAGALSGPPTSRLLLLFKSASHAEECLDSSASSSSMARSSSPMVKSSRRKTVTPRQQNRRNCFRLCRTARTCTSLWVSLLVMRRRESLPNDARVISSPYWTDYFCKRSIWQRSLHHLSPFLESGLLRRFFGSITAVITRARLRKYVYFLNTTNRCSARHPRWPASPALVSRESTSIYNSHYHQCLDVSIQKSLLSHLKHLKSCSTFYCNLEHICPEDSFYVP